MADFIAIILFVLWAPHIKRRFFYYLYFWQLKSYRLDRSLEDIKKDKEANKEAALAAAVIHSEYFKSRVKSTPEINMHWKNKLGSS